MLSKSFNLEVGAVMKRKFLQFLITILLLLSILCFSVACGSTVEEPAHEHSFSNDWKKNETHHYHLCLCGEKQDYNVHSFDDGEITLQPTKTEKGEQAINVSYIR